MSRWHSRTAARWAAALVVPVLAALAGCAGPGRLHDLGATRPLRTPHSPEALWDAVGTTPSAAPSVSLPPPSAVPGVTVPGEDIHAVDVRGLLRQEPGTPPDERSALDGCTGCRMLDPRYRDLTGDGRAELLVGVLAVGRAYLHAYQLRDHQVYPILELSVPSDFTADTLGTDLVVHEPTSSATGTTGTYHWNGTQLVQVETTATGPDTGSSPGCPKGFLSGYPFPMPPPSSKASKPGPKPPAPSTTPSPEVRS